MRRVACLCMLREREREGVACLCMCSMFAWMLVCVHHTLDNTCLLTTLLIAASLSTKLASLSHTPTRAHTHTHTHILQAGKQGLEVKMLTQGAGQHNKRPGGAGGESSEASIPGAHAKRARVLAGHLRASDGVCVCVCLCVYVCMYVCMHACNLRPLARVPIAYHVYLSHICCVWHICLYRAGTFGKIGSCS